MATNRISRRGLTLAAAGIVAAAVLLLGPVRSRVDAQTVIKTPPVIYTGAYVAPTAAPAPAVATPPSNVSITTKTVVYAGEAPPPSAPTAAPAPTQPASVTIRTATVIYSGKP